MKINPIMNQNLIKSYQAAKQVAQPKQQSEKKLDEVTFSEQALSFTKVMSEVREKVRSDYRTPEENARISEIKEAVQQGRYRVDSEKIAERMLESIILR